MFNIAVLSSGSQSSISILKSLINLKQKKNIKIFAFDISKYAAGLYLADEYRIIKKFTDRDYLKNLISVIKDCKLNYLLPQLDDEILFLLEKKNIIEKETKCKIIINSKYTCINAFNKFKANIICKKNNINIPMLINPLNKINSFNKIIYRKFKSIGSRGLKIYDPKSINALNKTKINNMLKNGFFQKYQKGQEFSIDIVCEQSKPIYIIPRKRKKIVDGQITMGDICLNTQLIKFSKLIINAFKIKHHACLQCIYYKKKIYFIELNPRFGTGMSLSELGGAKLTEVLIFKNIKKLNHNIKQVKFSRYWSEVKIH